MRIPLLLASLAAWGCGQAEVITASPTDPLEGATLSVAPADLLVTLENGTPRLVTYAVSLRYRDGRVEDVTSDSLLTLDRPMGLMAHNQLTLDGATLGAAQVHATWKQLSASADVRVARVDVRLDAGVADTVPALFNSPNQGSPSPTIVYPPPDLVVPRNLGTFEAHFSDSTNTWFEVTLQSTYATIKTYTNQRWAAFTPEEWQRVAGEGVSAEVSIRGALPDAGGGPAQVSASSSVKLAMSHDTLEGGLYYWAASADNGRYGIYRHDMAKPGEPAEEYLVKTAGTRCVACHALSRDGTKMAFTYDGGNGQGGIVSDIANKTVVDAQGTNNRWNFSTYSPDASVLVTVYGGALSLRDGTTGDFIKALPTTELVTHPDFRPDGKALVYVAHGGGSDWTTTAGNIVTRPYDEATQTLGDPVVLVDDTVNLFYPSWSPDGEWIVYNRATAGNAYNNARATMWAVKADGTGNPIPMATADIGEGYTNSWIRWAPFRSTMGEGTQLYWVTVSSKRAFGVRLPAGRPQLWMFPFYPAKAAAGEDPSGPAFRLPFQELTSSNHIAQWTERYVPIN